MVHEEVVFARQDGKQTSGAPVKPRNRGNMKHPSRAALLVALVAGVAVAGVLYLVVGIVLQRTVWGHRAAETDFRCLGRPYAASWRTQTSPAPPGGFGDGLGVTFRSEEAFPLADANQSVQPLASNALKNRWGYRFLYWTIFAHGWVTQDGKGYLFTLHSARGLRSGTFSGTPSARFRHRFDRARRILEIDVCETFGGQSRTTTLAYGLTPKGFTLLEDAERSTAETTGAIPGATQPSG
jgi:hypothetical protein